MEPERIKELNFLLRTNSTIPVTDSRRNEIFQTVFYSDFYTIQELISEGHIEYVGHQKDLLCLRPFNNFSIYIAGKTRKLKGGEIITMSLSTSGRNEFEEWLATTK